MSLAWTAWLFKPCFEEQLVVRFSDHFNVEGTQVYLSGDILRYPKGLFCLVRGSGCLSMFLLSGSSFSSGVLHNSLQVGCCTTARNFHTNQQLALKAGLCPCGLFLGYAFLDPYFHLRGLSCGTFYLFPIAVLGPELGCFISPEASLWKCLGYSPACFFFSKVAFLVTITSTGV